MTGKLPSPTVLFATAHHEAGHAVAAFALRIPVKRVSIMPDAKRSSAGCVYIGPSRSVDAMHRQGIVALAGEAAQRRYNPRSVRGHHGGGDRQVVAEYAFERTGSGEQATLLARLWELQARDLVEKRWDTIQRVAAALLKWQTLNAEQVRMLAFRVRIADEVTL